jgi:hypothetical protein
MAAIRLCPAPRRSHPILCLAVRRLDRRTGLLQPDSMTAAAFRAVGLIQPAGGSRSLAYAGWPVKFCSPPRIPLAEQRRSGPQPGERALPGPLAQGHVPTRCGTPATSSPAPGWERPWAVCSQPSDDGCLGGARAARRRRGTSRHQRQAARQAPRSPRAHDLPPAGDCPYPPRGSAMAAGDCWRSADAAAPRDPLTYLLVASDLGPAG